MTTSPRWRSVVASAATAAALFAAPLAGAGTALAMDNPSPCPSHSTKPPYPPYPPKPHGYGDDSGDSYGEDSGYGYGDDCGSGNGNGSDNGHENGNDNGSGSGSGSGGHENGNGNDNGSEGGHENGNGHDKGHDKGSGHLANTGDDNTKELILGGVAAGLVALGVGSLLVVRRRSNS